MNKLLEFGAKYLINNYPLAPETKGTIAKASKIMTPLLLVTEQRQITFERHPLQTLYQLLKQPQDFTAIENAVYAIPRELRGALFREVFLLHSASFNGGKKWELSTALADQDRLLKAIRTVVRKKFDELLPEKKRAVSLAAFRMAGEPQTWGPSNVKGDTSRLIRALHRNQCLDISGMKIRVYSDLESGITARPSTSFHLHRPELERGQICLINGLNNNFEYARESAEKYSDESAQGYNLHCVYSATVDTKWDYASGLICHGGTPTPPVLHLLDVWQDYFEINENDKLLHICHSRGAAETYRALELLPSELKERIIVITLAGACTLPENIAYKVRNLVILSDPVVQIAAFPENLDEAHTIKLEHNGEGNVHDPHNSSYRAALGPLVRSYIRTNDIPDIRAHDI